MWVDQKNHNFFDSKEEVWKTSIYKDEPKKCLHESCENCCGTGRGQNGQSCVHMLSCPCPKCSPSY